MKKRMKIICLTALALALLVEIKEAPAQGMLYAGIAQTVATVPGAPSGMGMVFVPIPNATITVCGGIYSGAACLTQTALVYQDQGLTIQITPYVGGDQYGNFLFWAAPGAYYYTVVGTVGGSTVQGTYQIQLPNAPVTLPTFAVNGTPLGATNPVNFVNGTNTTVSNPSGGNVAVNVATAGEYQTLQIQGTPLPQEPILNFYDPIFIGTDSPGSTRSNIAVNRTGSGNYVATASSSALPGSSTGDAGWDGSGNLKAGVGRTCSGTYPANLICWKRSADGTVEAWGSITVTNSSGTTATGTINFPQTGPLNTWVFTTTPILTVSGGDQPDTTGSDDSYSVYFTSLTYEGAIVVARCSVNIGGSGCPSINNTVPIHWHAIGY